MPFFSKNVDLKPALKISSWRKVAIGTWQTAADPSVYGMLEVDAGPAIAYIEKQRRETGVKLTLTHFAGRAVAEVLARHPDLNCVLRFGRLYPRNTVDVFFQVAADETGQDLSGMVVRSCNRKSLAEISREMQERVLEIRTKGDPAFKKMKNLMGLMPGMLSSIVLKFSSLLLYTLNLWTPLLGTPRDPFGSVMVTSIGSLGLDMAFAPLVPYSRVPVLLAVGAARETPVVTNGAVTIATMLNLCVTFDHRLIDGVQGSKMAKTMARIFADPERELSSERYS
jgi:pyruvate/2-oxoglutarate dehydrogenase complex dihydrolipoamide acyltransferase (E2) component